MPDMELSCRQRTVSCIEKLIKEAESEDDLVVLPVYETLKVLKDALELLKKEQPRCKDCRHYHKGAHFEDGTEIQDNVGVCSLLERVLSGDVDYCSYHTGWNDA